VMSPGDMRPFSMLLYVVISATSVVMSAT
jgi:hypothetical protein